MKKQQHILIVDDEQDILDILAFNLRSAGYEVRTAESAAEALAAEPQTFDLLLLDVMMPGMSGFELARQLGGVVPVIFLTAKDTEADTLRGFELGADDYVAKPFSVREVMARVRAVLTRTQPAAHATSPTLSHEGLCLDLAQKSVTLDGNPIALTKTEFELLRLLLADRSRIHSRTELLHKAWPADVIVTDRTVDVNIARLRKKIGRYAQCLVARPGFGYAWKGVKVEG